MKNSLKNVTAPIKPFPATTTSNECTHNCATCSGGCKSHISDESVLPYEDMRQQPVTGSRSAVVIPYDQIKNNPAGVISFIRDMVPVIGELEEFGIPATGYNNITSNPDDYEDYSDMTQEQYVFTHRNDGYIDPKLLDMRELEKEYDAPVRYVSGIRRDIDSDVVDMLLDIERAKISTLLEYMTQCSVTDNQTITDTVNRIHNRIDNIVK